MLEKIKSISQIYSSWKTDLLSRGLAPKLPINLKDLDDILWGLHKKDLVIIAGRPSEGKTSLSLQIAWEIANQGKIVYFISLEMNKESLLERLFCQQFKVRNEDLRRGNLTDEIKGNLSTFKNIIEAEEMKLLITDGIGYIYKDLKTLIEEFNPNPDVVILDYIQMVSVMGRYSSYEALTEYIRAFKEMANVHNFVGILLSQINRAPLGRTDKRPTMGDLKGTGTLEEAADVLMTLYWPYRNNDEESSDPNLFEINILKQRHGATGKVFLNFYPQYSLFEDRTSFSYPTRKGDIS